MFYPHISLSRNSTYKIILDIVIEIKRPKDTWMHAVAIVDRMRTWAHDKSKAY